MCWRTKSESWRMAGVCLQLTFQYHLYLQEVIEIRRCRSVVCIYILLD
jgi:hypothetical protein